MKWIEKVSKEVPKHCDFLLLKEGLRLGNHVWRDHPDRNGKLERMSLLDSSSDWAELPRKRFLFAWQNMAVPMRWDAPRNSQVPECWDDAGFSVTWDAWTRQDAFTKTVSEKAEKGEIFISFFAKQVNVYRWNHGGFLQIHEDGTGGFSLDDAKSGSRSLKDRDFLSLLEEWSSHPCEQHSQFRETLHFPEQLPLVRRLETR